MTAWDSLQSCDIEVTDGELPQVFLCERLSLVKRTKPLRLPHERLFEDVAHEAAVAEVLLSADSGELRAFFSCGQYSTADVQKNAHPL